MENEISRNERFVVVIKSSPHTVCSSSTYKALSFTAGREYSFTSPRSAIYTKMFWRALKAQIGNWRSPSSFPILTRLFLSRSLSLFLSLILSCSHQRGKDHSRWCCHVRKHHKTGGCGVFALLCTLTCLSAQSIPTHRCAASVHSAFLFFFQYSIPVSACDALHHAIEELFIVNVCANTCEVHCFSADMIQLQNVPLYAKFIEK